MRRRVETTDAPEFPEGLEWLNIGAPLRLRNLRGKVVLLNFFTSCSINCMHVLPDIKKLMASHGPVFVAIGVHAAKCTAERDIERLRAAVQRMEIDYPVVNDRDMQVWQAYDVEAWPTSVLIDPQGRVVSRLKGEGVRASFDETIGDIIRDAERIGGLQQTPLPQISEQSDQPDGALTFPAGILADERSRRLFISDTGGHRIIAADLEGRVLTVAGMGDAGLSDGSFETARFREPHGLALDGNVLYVADRGNHAIRRLDFAERTVQTIAGTGERAPALVEPGEGLSTALHSPWDVEIVHHRLYITMPGAHQIWRQDLQSSRLEAYAGGGSAGMVDGSRANSLLAQPSGLTSDGVRLFFADAGASAIRWVYLPPGVQLGTWVGQGIFEYGDRDGPGREALLQFPLDVVHSAGDIYIADTFNNKIKCLNPRTAHVETFLGTGQAGHSDGNTPTFNQPRALSCGDGRLWIADTDNHAIRMAPLGGGPVTTLQLHQQ